MLLSELDFDQLEGHTPEKRWGAGTDRDRFLYRDDNFWYKVWGPRYLAVSPYASNGAFHKPSAPWTKPHGFEVGLFTPEISGAFESFIWDAEGIIRGYITKAGRKPGKLSDAFVDATVRACVTSGWVYADFCYNNVVEINGSLSLIDFDTHLTKLNCMDIEFERDKGALRVHTHPRFAQLIKEAAVLYRASG